MKSSANAGFFITVLQSMTKCYWRAVRDAISTIIRERDPDVLQTVQMIKEIIKSQSEDHSVPLAA